MDPVEGSIAWAMNRGTLFQVSGASQYGEMFTCCETPLEAAKSIFWKFENQSRWLPSGTKLVVWNVYGGSIGGFCMKDPVEFVTFQNRVREVAA